MSDEPEVDEAAFNAAQRVTRLIALRGTPLEGDSCGSCHYYLEPGEPMAFCWHKKVNLLVSDGWWCQHWELAGT